jgi:general secretion pathway protein D
VSRVLKYRSVFISLCLLVTAGAWSPWAFGQSARKGEYEVYPCRYKPAHDVEKLLSDLLPADPSVHLVVDAKSNALLLRGPAEAQQIAKTLLQHVDRPDAAPTNSQPDTTVVKAYDVPAADLDRSLGVVRALCGQRRDVKATSSRDTHQIIVLAPPELHAVIAARLAQGFAPSPASPDEVAPADSPTPSSADTERVLPLRALDAEGIEQRLIALFGRRLRVAQRDGSEVFVLPVAPQRVLEFSVDRTRRMVHARGPEPLVSQFATLVDALDAGGQPGQKTRALHVERTAPQQLEEAVDAYRGRVPETSPPELNRGDQSSNLNVSTAHPVRLVNYLQQPEPGGIDATAPADQANDMGTVVPNVPGLEDLEVQTLPDLDVIILRGRDQDVEQLTKIIRELERLSAETKPRIYIYPLTHTLGSSMAQIIEEVQTDLVGGRQGRVTVTPLVKPNALLLIGWGEAVESIIELISKLDQPVPPESQFSVFALKHAVATTVQQTIQQFFITRTGLGPKVQSAVDARTNSLIVYASPRDMAEVKRLVEELDVSQSGAVNRAQIIRVYNALAADIADTLEQTIAAARVGQSGRSAVLELMAVDERGQEILRSGMLNEVNITANPRNNTLIVTGPREAMPLIEAFIKQLDSPGDRAQIKVFRVLNGDATNLVTMLRALMPSQIGQVMGPQLPSAPEEESLAPLRFSVEVRSNSIIAIGSEGDLRIVEALLTRLDQSESMNRKNVVYMLKNAPALDVASSINQFLQSQRQLEAAEPGQSNPFQDLEREVIVVPEAVGNRLIVSATPRYFDEITQLIEKLDAPPPQVVIQVLIAEVTLGDRDELGVELGLQDSVLFDRSLLGDLVTTTNTMQVSDPSGIRTVTEEFIRAASLTPGFDFNGKILGLGNSGSTSSIATGRTTGGQALSNFAVGRMNDDAGFGGLVLSASSQNVSVLIRALQETRELRILSRPLVRTLDNQPAFIQVGQRVPRIVGSSVSTYGQSNSIANENVGLILGVTPRISPDGNVVMEIDAEKSKVGPEEEGIPVAVSMDGTIIRSPRVDTVTAQATVSVADGETVVLGGMISTEKETIERRVPLLSDVPVLGHLFRFDGRNDKRNEMLIILTPRVIRSQEEGERIKQAEFARMSWCAADVYEIYGDPGMDFQTNLSVPSDDLNTEVIYPDLNPRGTRTANPSAPLPGQYPRSAPGTGGNGPPPGQLPQPVPSLPSGADRPVLNPALSQASAEYPAGTLPPQAAARISQQPQATSLAPPAARPVYGPSTPNSWNDPRR